MRVAIIGAGGAGLASAKCCLDANLDFDVFEQTGTVGGTWNYCEKTGVDENGLVIHTSMYQNLRTNLPKEVMAMEGMSYSEDIEKSYLTHTEVLDYIHLYTNHFQLHKFIKFFKQVTKVKLQDENSFLIKFKDVINNTEEEATYSHVIVCNGHFFDYTIPNLEGLKSFTGKITHSHDYRVPEPYKNKTVVIVGCGPSGLNISEDIAGVANKVFLSHSREIKDLPHNVLQKPPIEKIHQDKIFFTDGSDESVDEILFCTGYDYTFPFLDPNCGIEIIEKKYVRPLYKHIINANNPNMAIIGIPFKVCPFPMFSLQAKFFLATIVGNFKLPPKEYMLNEIVEYEEKMTEKNTPLRHYHTMENKMGEYFNELADTAKISRLPSVIDKLYKRARMSRNIQNCYKILDDETFLQIN